MGLLQEIKRRMYVEEIDTVLQMLCLINIKK